MFAYFGSVCHFSSFPLFHLFHQTKISLLITCGRQKEIPNQGPSNHNFPDRAKISLLSPKEPSSGLLWGFLTSLGASLKLRRKRGVQCSFTLAISFPAQPRLRPFDFLFVQAFSTLRGIRNRCAFNQSDQSILDIPFPQPQRSCSF